MGRRPLLLRISAALALGVLLPAPNVLADGTVDFEAQAAAVAAQARQLLQDKGPAAASVPASVARELGALPTPADQVQPEGLPKLGKWMLDHKGNVANWLGERYKGKHFAEPINVIIRVDTSDPAIAEKKLLSAARAGGFKDQFGHTSGYQARIEGVLAKQYPRKNAHALSDRCFLHANDHGRLFGPVLWQGRQYFVGAFSRENVKIVVVPPKFRHPYASFLEARERFVKRMALAELLGYVPMANAIAPDDSTRTTGDHDGKAALLELK